MSILSKSKPDNPINKFKLKLINERLKEANKILIGDFKPFNDFEVFDEDNLPSNSDVVFILSQYLDALEGWRSANVTYNQQQFRWVWKTQGNAKIYTSPPSRYKRSPNT